MLFKKTDYTLQGLLSDIDIGGGNPPAPTHIFEPEAGGNASS